VNQTLCDRCGEVLDHFGFKEAALREAGAFAAPSHYATPIGAKAADNMNIARDYCRQCLDEILGLAARKVKRPAKETK